MQHDAQTSSNSSTSVALSFEQERCLKQQLLKVAIQDEVDRFLQKPEVIDESMFLKFMKDKVLEFPLWSKKDKAQAKTLELIMTLPQLCKQASKATKRDTNNKALRILVAKAMGLMMRTPLEHTHDAHSVIEIDQKWEQDVQLLERAAPQDEAKLARSHKKISELFRTLLTEAGQQEGGYNHIFRMVKETPKLENLPPMYRAVAAEMSQAMALFTESALLDDKQLSKLKKIQLLTPVKAIRGVLAISNPVNLMKGLLSIFMARPFGARNLIQRFTEVLLETKKTESLLKDTQKDVDASIKPLGSLFRKSLHQKVEKYVKDYADLLEPEMMEDDTPTDDDEEEKPALVTTLTPRELVNRILRDETVLPILDAELITKIPDAGLLAIYEMVMAHLRVNEKEVFIEFMGNEQMLDIVRELLPVVHEPISALFKRADVGRHFDILFQTLHRIIKVAEMKQHPGATRIQMYQIVMDQFLTELYDFIHNIAASDDNTLDNTIRWCLNLMDFMNRENLAVQTLMTDLPVAKHDQIVHELNNVIEYKRILAEIKKAEEEEMRNAPGVPEGQAPPKPKAPVDLPKKPSTSTISTLTPDFVPLAASLLNKARNL